MASRKHIKRQLREQPEFLKWLKGNPDLYRQIMKDPSNLEEIIHSWKREQNKQAQLQKIGLGYRQVVSQIQELNTLMERVDTLVSNIKKISDGWSEYKDQFISKDPATATEISTKNKKSKLG